MFPDRGRGHEGSYSDLSLSGIVNMKILFTGGGTLGSVTPLLALHDALSQRAKRKNTSYEPLWIGTLKGPEKDLVIKAAIPFRAIATGKFRRYFSLRNIVDPIFLLAGLFQSLFIVVSFRPDVIVNAGSFVGVSVIFAGWLSGCKSIIFQPDILPILSNRVTAPFTKCICVAIDEAKKYFPKIKTIVTGMPVRFLGQAQEMERTIRKRLHINEGEYVIYVTGGGTGSQRINELVCQAVPALVKFAHIIHVTGKKKMGASGELEKEFGRYHPIEFTADESEAYAGMADIVVTRAGMGTLAELSVLGKPSIIVPLPNSPQEKNAEYFANQDAAVVLTQDTLTSEVFLQTLASLLDDTHLKRKLSINIAHIFSSDAAEKFADVIEGVV